MATSITDVQKIVVALSEPDLVVEPGTVSQLTVTIVNQQDSPDRLSLEIEGIDVEWYAIPVPAVNVASGAQAVLKVPFRVARTSANRAGTYPFLVRVQALETGEVGVAQATLNVNAFSALQAELNPKRMVATFFHALNEVDVSITNDGNVEETLDLFASDPDDGCAYEYDTDRITVKPGQTAVVGLAVRPKVAALIGGTRIYGFTASARSTDDSYICTNVHGQIEKHALISPLFGIFLLLLAITSAGIVAFRPKPLQPIKIARFIAVPKTVEQGRTTILTWEVNGLTRPERQLVLSHHVGENGAEIIDGEVPQDNSKQEVTPDLPLTVYTLTAKGSQGQKPDKSSVTVHVIKAPAPPAPVIKMFAVNPRKIHLGDAVTFIWTAINQKSFILDPGNKQLSQFEESATDSPTQDTEYKLRAFNVKGDVATKTVQVKVLPVNVCIAEVAGFGIKSAAIVGAPVRLRWSTRYARSVNVISTDPNITIGDVSPDDFREISFSSTTPVVFTLTATDSANKSVTKTLTITPKPKPVPPPVPNDTIPPVTAPSGGATPGAVSPGGAAPDTKIGQ
jgi:hypothetical protein